MLNFSSKRISIIGTNEEKDFKYNEGYVKMINKIHENKKIKNVKDKSKFKLTNSCNLI
jgi:hypothetical protein